MFSPMKQRSIREIPKLITTLIIILNTGSMKRKYQIKDKRDHRELLHYLHYLYKSTQLKERSHLVLPGITGAIS